MRTFRAVALLCLLSTVLVAQKQKRIFLSPKSNITTAQIAEGFPKNCPNVVITQNEQKADYVLEAAETVSADEGTTDHQWHFTLVDVGIPKPISRCPSRLLPVAAQKSRPSSKSDRSKR
jgi:hypothetical protein